MTKYLVRSPGTAWNSGARASISKAASASVTASPSEISTRDRCIEPPTQYGDRHTRVITIALQYPSVVARRSDARRRAIAATSELVQEQGYAATGLEEILSRSGAPKGSFYFHFPGGKEQLVAEAVAASGDGIRQLIDAVVSDAKTPQEAIRAIASFQARQLAESGFEHGCPIATVT